MGTLVQTIKKCKFLSVGYQPETATLVLPDQHLDDLVMSIQQHGQFPMCGNQKNAKTSDIQMIPHTTVQVRKSQQRVNPQGTISRWLECIGRNTQCLFLVL